jgi:hypothetical protein
MENRKHWWLRTSDIRSVFTDQKGNYRLEWEPGYIIVEFTEGQLPEVNMETSKRQVKHTVSVDFPAQVTGGFARR